MSIAADRWALGALVAAGFLAAGHRSLGLLPLPLASLSAFPSISSPVTADSPLAATANSPFTAPLFMQFRSGIPVSMPLTAAPTHLGIPPIEPALIARQTTSKGDTPLGAGERAVTVDRGTDHSILDFSLTTLSYVTATQLENAFGSTEMAGLGEAFVHAESTYGVNALALASIAIWESAWGTSHYAQTRNNLFGFGAYTKSPDSAVWYSTKWESVQAAASLLQRQYLSPDGLYYRDGTFRTIGLIYADGNEGWAPGVAKVMSLLLRKTEL